MRARIGDVEFGGMDTGIFITGWDTAGRSTRASRHDRPLGHGAFAGPEWFATETWTFELATNGRTMADSEEIAGRLERAWWAHLPGSGESVALQYQTAPDRPWRTVYGRPTRFVGPASGILSLQGAGRARCEFELLDPRKYSSNVQSVTIGIVSESTGGIIAPLWEPISADGTFTGTSARWITVGGDAPTPISVTFSGPLVDPRATIDGQEVGISGTVAEDLAMTIDGRRSTVTRADGSHMPGRLTYATRLDHLTVSPGRHEVIFSGFSPTNTGSATVTWMDASYSI